MIIPSLINYYNRLAHDPDSNVAPFGWSRQKVSFKVVIDASGKFKSIDDERGEEESGKKKVLRPKLLTLPGQSKPSGSGIHPCFLWDNPAYMLGLAVDEKSPGKKVDTKRIRQSFEAFRARHLALEREVDHEHFTAVCKFLKNWDPAEHKDEAKKLAEYVPGFGVFQIRGQSEFVHDREEIKAYWNRSLESPPEESDDDPPPRLPSLVTGEPEPLARLHEPKIKGVAGAQSSGATLVSFNIDSAVSFNKVQSYNAPVGERDAFAYCTALNYLLEDKTRRVTIGEDTYVVWAERPVPFEQDVADLMGNTAPAAASSDEGKQGDEAEDRDRARLLHEALQSIREGKGVPKSLGDANVPFYILGLSPNAARLHVRYWLKTTLGELAKNLAHHFAALKLDGEPPGYRPPSIRDIVGETLPPDNGWPDHSRADKGLAAQILRAVLTGGPYPDRLLAGVIDRVRAEGLADPEKRHMARNVAHRRASIIKACLIRTSNPQLSRQEVPMSLDPTYDEPAYHLGRIFSILANIQEDAMPGINSTIERRYFGAAFSAPATVLGRLHHLAVSGHLPKLENVRMRDAYNDMLASAWQDLRDAAALKRERTGSRGPDVPRTLTLVEQALFVEGYYIQMPERPMSQIPRVRGDDGILYRSKSESMIASTLNALGLKFEYETRLVVKGVGAVLPDFTIRERHPSGMTVYIEHLGLTNEKSYQKTWSVKRSTYAAGGIAEFGTSECKHGILFTTTEDDVRDMPSLQARLKDIFAGR